MSEEIRSCRTTRKKLSFLGLSGTFLLVLGAFYFSKAGQWIQSIINSRLVINPSSPIYEQWRSPTVPVRMQFFMFNVVNPLEVKQGRRPFVSQKGPYCYRVYQKRKNITWNTNLTVTYNKFTKYVFSAECSCSSCDPHKNTITLPNVPLVILSEVSKMYPGSSLIFSIIFRRFNEEFFKVTTVNEILWGYRDPVFELFAELKRKFRLSFLPDIDPIFRMMDNDTLDGITTIYTGASDIRRVGVWTRWKGKPDVGLWNSSWANMFNGSDGMQFPPQTRTGDKLYAFYVQLCRAMLLVYDSPNAVYGVDTLRFTHSAGLWQNTTVNPANKGFCPNGCFPSGILDASVCKDTPVAVPAIVASQPHFYQGDPALVHSVEGLRPNKEEHATFFDIEPHLGLPLHLNLRLQLNVNTKSTKSIMQMAGIRDVILPIMYFNNSVTVCASTAHTVKAVLIPIHIVSWISAALMCIGIIELVVVFSWVMMMKRRKGYKRNETSNNNDSNNEKKKLIGNGKSN